jgi:hypothetical protein
MLRDTLLTDSFAVAADTAWTDTVIFALQRRLAPGAAYRLRLPLSAFEDFAGNSPQPLDSTDSVDVSFRTIAGNELCMSMAGSAACSTFAKGEKRRWIFSSFGGERGHTCDDSAGAFRFDSLPAAKGRMTLFADRNGDGSLSPGSLYPWRPPEPFVLFADTVEARARWDVSGIGLQGCDACIRIIKTQPSGARPDQPQSTKPRDNSFQRPTIPIGQ